LVYIERDWVLILLAAWCHCLYHRTSRCSGYHYGLL